MVAVAEQVLDGWRPGQRLDIAQEMQKLTLRIASKALFGLDTAAQADALGVDRRRFFALCSLFFVLGSILWNILA
jgi:cytochrome P450